MSTREKQENRKIKGVFEDKYRKKQKQTKAEQVSVTHGPAGGCSLSSLFHTECGGLVNHSIFCQGIC